MEIILLYFTSQKSTLLQAHFYRIWTNETFFLHLDFTLMVSGPILVCFQPTGNNQVTVSLSQQVAALSIMIRRLKPGLELWEIPRKKPL